MNEFIDRSLERMDELNIKGWQICQNAGLFRFGIDAILLAGAAKLKKTDAVCDLCSGTGIVPFLFLARDDVPHVTAVEYFDYFCELMKKTAEHNGCSDRIDIVNRDVKEIDKSLKKASFDVVTVNPPYEKDGHGIDCPNPIKNAARREVLCDVDDVVRAGAYLLKTGGRMYIIHRPWRLCDLFFSLRENGIEPRTVRLIQSKEGEKPNLVTVEAIKGAPPYLKVLENMTIYDQNGNYTEESRKIYDERV